MNSNRPMYQELENQIGELEKKAEFFRLIADYSVNCELFRNTEGKVLYCNNAFEIITGYAVTELISGKITEKDLVHPNDWQFVLNQMQESLNFVRQEVDIDFRILTKDKQIKTIKLLYCF